MPHARTLPGVASGVALIFVRDDGENMIGVAPGANARLGPGDIDRLPDALFTPDRLLLIAGLEVPLDMLGDGRQAAHESCDAGHVAVEPVGTRRAGDGAREDGRCGRRYGKPATVPKSLVAPQVARASRHRPTPDNRS